MRHTCLFESGIDGYHTYRIPALAVSVTGTILAFCEARKFTGEDYDKIDLYLRRSFDNGQTWQPRQMLISDGDRTCGNPCPVIDGNTLWLPFCKDSQSVFIMRSDDDGASWSDPVEITENVKDPACPYVGTGPGHGIRLQSGRLLIPSWMDEGTGPVSSDPSESVGGIQSSYIIFSDDQGISWKHGQPLNRGWSNECEAVELAEGTLHMTLRGGIWERRRGHACSHDGGDSWSALMFDDCLPQPDCQGSIIGLEDDTVILSHPSDPEGRAKLTVYASTDGCQTWPAARVLCAGPAAYSDLAVANDGKILCFYEHLEENNRYAKLMLARFPREWIYGNV